MTDRCDGCGVEITIAGGIADIWSQSGSATSGMTLELSDGSTFLLCFECIEALPDDPSTADVAALE